MIKTLMFDLGDVIVGLDFERAYRRVAALRRYAVVEVPELIRRSGLAHPYERGEISSGEFHREFCRALGLNLSYEQFQEIWEDMFQPEPLLPDSFFAALRENYRLVLVSNTNEIHFDSIRQRYPMLGHFDEFVLSYRVGSLKPSPAIYEEAIRAARCRSRECFFTDDKAENVEAARQAGIDAVLFESRKGLEEELHNRGVL